MTIAVLTYWSSSDNYGQILQCYALQRYLCSEGHSAYLVKYEPAEQKLSVRRRLLVKLKSIVIYWSPVRRKAVKKFANGEKALKSINAELNKQRKFDEFRENFVNSTDIIYRSIEELRSNPPKADIYICGSDQIWRDNLSSPNIAGWYLQFGDKKIRRISYAPSIGRAFAKSEERIFKEYLTIFDAVSLREQSTCDLCARLGIKHPIVVCDPTILLNGETYSKFFNVVPVRETVPYIFFYTLNILSIEDLPWPALSQLIQTKNWKIKSVGSSGYYQARNIIPNINNIPATIPEWLSYIANSEFVVTTSFHGIVFSILMHRPFMAVLLTGKKSGANDRIINFLSGLGLDDRICYSNEDVFKIEGSYIDWNSVENKISKMRENGINFLKQNIK